MTKIELEEKVKELEEKISELENDVDYWTREYDELDEINDDLESKLDDLENRVLVEDFDYMMFKLKLDNLYSEPLEKFLRNYLEV